METLFYILVVLASLCSIFNTVVLIFMAIFLVNFRDRLKEFFNDLVQMVASQEPISLPTIEISKKTWDEKYEEELMERERRRRSEAGLQDLAMPNYVPLEIKKD